MGGAVSAGCDNNDLIDNLVASNYIRTSKVQQAFRAVDRADYMAPQRRDQAYKDMAWKEGLLHLSAPCIYSEVMEGLELEEGMSFLNLGSGTGYLSTLVGLLLSSHGINHGIEIYGSVIEFANKRLKEFIKNSPAVDEFDFCEPKFMNGNALCLPPTLPQYDRVYCGAACPQQYENYLKNLIKVNGIVIVPMNDTLIQIKRISSTEWKTKSLLSVSFATLVMPELDQFFKDFGQLEMTPQSLQILTRSIIRNELRQTIYREQPQLLEEPIRPLSNKNNCTRRICIPIGQEDGFNVFHDLDEASGAGEMNALLSLVLNIGRNRVAGALRFDNVPDSDIDDTTSSESSYPDDYSNVEPLESEDYVPNSSETSDSPRDDVDINRISDEVVDNKNTITEASSTNCQVETGGNEENHCIKSVASDNTVVTTNQNKVLENEKLDADNLISKDSGNLMGPSTSAEINDLNESDHEMPPAKINSKDMKREKLDSGIGEENLSETTTPLDASAGINSSDSDTEFIVSKNLTENHRPKKRTRRSRSEGSSSTDRDSSDEDTEDPIRPTKQKVKKIVPPDPSDIRRDKISLLLRNKVNQLPLPIPLRIYVNMGRVFE